MKTKVFFSRRTPFYLVSPLEADDGQLFDAYEVEVEKSTMANVRALRKLIMDMEETFSNNPAPEECVAEEVAKFEAGVRRIFKTKAS